MESNTKSQEKREIATAIRAKVDELNELLKEAEKLNLKVLIPYSSGEPLEILEISEIYYPFKNSEEC